MSVKNPNVPVQRIFPVVNGTYATVAALEALASPTSSIIVRIEEFGGKRFQWIASDTTAVDHYRVLGHTGGPAGNWVLQDSEIELRPIDGVNSDDAPKLNAAVAALAGFADLKLLPGFSVAAGVVTILPFILASSLLLQTANKPIKVYGIGSGIQLHGTPAGPGTRLYWKGAGASPVVSVGNGMTTVVLRDFAVDNSAIGGSLATHGIYSETSDQLQISNIVMFPTVGTGFTTAGIELGSPAGGLGVSKAHISNCLIRNCAVGTQITDVIVARLTAITHIDCGTCTVVGTVTTTAYAVTYDSACTFEARTGQTGIRIVRANSVSFYEPQVDAWDNTHFGLEILSSAALVTSVSIFGGRFTGNTVPYGIKVDFASATLNLHGVFFSGFTTSGIKNVNNKALSLYDCHSDNAAIPVIDSLTNGNVRVYGNDINGTVGVDQLGGSTGAAIRTFLQLGGGTQPTTGLIRFPKPSESSTLMVLRREASAVDIPILVSDTGSGLTFGDTTTGAFGDLKLQSGSTVQIFAPIFYLREAGNTIRHTISIAAATTWSVASGSSLDFQYNGTTDLKIGSSGIGFFGGTGFGGGIGVAAWGNANTNPTTNPSGGSVVYVSAGATIARGSSGTVTTMAPA